MILQFQWCLGESGAGCSRCRWQELWLGTQPHVCQRAGEQAALAAGQGEQLGGVTPSSFHGGTCQWKGRGSLNLEQHFWERGRVQHQATALSHIRFVNNPNRRRWVEPTGWWERRAVNFSPSQRCIWMHHIFTWTLSPRQGLHHLFGGHSSGGYEICELPACKWISNCCKYSFQRKWLSIRGEKRLFFKKKLRQYTVHLNVFSAYHCIL